MHKISSYDKFIKISRDVFGKIQDTRQQSKVKISLVDHIMSAFGIFALKYPSLLKYDKEIRGETESIESQNFRNLFGVANTPDDSSMRQTLDEVSPKEMREPFKVIVSDMIENKNMEPFIFYRDSYLLAIDGTGYFSSHEVHCENCCEKKHKDGTVTYHHQMLGAAFIHPDIKQVIPLAPEPIHKQDGNSKNDCERNAVKRLLKSIREDHPHLEFTITEDALSANFPHVQELKKHNMHFILGIKPGDHKNFFKRLNDSDSSGLMLKHKIKKEKMTLEFSFINGILLKFDEQESSVNFIECTETDSKGRKKKFSWITDFIVTTDNIEQLMKGGRARWRIENEVFNTLKNQGYQFEHNFGHGKKNLSSNFAFLMMLAFLIDQASELLCASYKAARKKAVQKYSLWEKMRNYFSNVILESWSVMFKIINGEYRVKFTIDTT
jgi:hypothetical protein